MTVAAYNRAKIAVYRQAGLTRVGVVPESVPRARAQDAYEEEPIEVGVRTAGDDRVCEECDDYAEGAPYDIDEVEDSLPLHPNCRCTWFPWDDRRFKRDAAPVKFGFASVQDAYDPNEPRDPQGRWTGGAIGELVGGVHVKGGGLWVTKGESHGKLPPKGTQLAAYTDPEGYTITLIGGTRKGEETAMGVIRYGTMKIVAPGGPSVGVKAGYFMNFPEESWNISEKQWKGMSWEHKAGMQVRHQATAYNSLKQQYEERLASERTKP